KNGGVPIEGPEPTVKSAHSPLWVFVMTGVLAYLGMGFLADRAGGFHKDVYEPYASAKYVKGSQPSTGDDPVARGAKVYEAKGCVGCHQASGLGTAGVNPPLAGSEWVTAEGPNRLIRIVLHGLNGPITVKGATYNGQMPPLGEGMTPREIADVLSFIRNSWGNQASIVKEAQVKAIVEKEKGKPQWKPADLLALPDK
ncbi:MAG: cytochrome c class, partial [Verrucomicrobia bacterium]|nr:cytochrome c class [Verrucomicrobiota bacterium]